MRGAAARLIELGTPRRWALLLGLTLLVAASEGLSFVLLVPLLARLGDGATPATAPGLPLPDLPLPALLAVFVGLVAVRAAAELARALAAQSFAARVVDALRMRAFAALVGAEWRALSAMNQSANRALIVSTADRVGHAADLAADGLRTGLSSLALGLAALAISPLAALAAALAGVLVTLAHARLRRRAETLGNALTERYAAIFLKLEQTLDALRLVKSFGREKAVLADVGEGFAAMRAVERGYIRDSGLAQAALHIAGAGAIALLVGTAHARGQIALATLLPLAALFARALPLLGALQSIGQRWRHEAPALFAVEALAAEAEAAAEPLPAGPAPRLREAIVLERVSFGHAAGRAALEAIEARIPAGEITALTGPSGAGKSTLADLIGGLLAADAGRVLVDGVALDGGLRTAWRSRVAYVQQEPVLFGGTVRDNLRWAAPERDDAALDGALARAAARFVHALPGGLDCDLGAAGRALSGGERQRIALARALLREPDLLILDEATSALDDASDSAIAAAVAALAGKCTVLVIGHRGALTGLATHQIALARGRNAHA